MRKVCDRFAPFKVVYAGLVVQRAQIDLFIKSMPIILKKYPETKFYITNQGEELNKIKRLSKELGVNPEFYWFEDSHEFYNFLATCHVGVVTSSNDLPRRIGPAVKLFDYLSVGLPVVANEIGGWTKIIKDEQVGLLTKCNPESFAQGIIKLLDNPDLSRRYGNMGLKLVNTKMNWDTSARALVNKYEQSLEKTSQDTIKLTTLINNDYLHAT
jgi:glycosyltransferase involved in cell wall biosynthesis